MCALAVSISLANPAWPAELPEIPPLGNASLPPSTPTPPLSEGLPALPIGIAVPEAGATVQAAAPTVFPLFVGGQDLRAEPEPRRVEAAVSAAFERSNLDAKPRDSGLKALGIGLAVAGVFVAGEYLGGSLTHSVSLRADSLHSAADWSINAAGLAALAVSRWRNQDKKGSGRVEASIGLASSGLIALTALEIAREAVARLLTPQPVAPLAAAAFALCGVAANLAPAIALYSHRREGVALGGVFLHALTDAAGSLAVAAGGVAAWALGSRWIDPAISALVVALIAHTAWDLARRSWAAFRGVKKQL